jgi:hypothetical protein
MSNGRVTSGDFGNFGGGFTDGSGATKEQSADILIFHKENKTRTNKHFLGNKYRIGKPLAEELGLRRVWRRVVDFGDPKSSGIGDAWGYKRVSVSRVSILDGPLPGRCKGHTEDGG